MAFRKLGAVLLILVLTSHQVSAEIQPAQKDYLSAFLGMGVAVGLEVVGKSTLIPSKPKWSEPNLLDRRIREKLYWGKLSQNNAISWSDRLLYGVSMSSLLWGPILDKHQHRSALVNLEVFAANAIVTNLVKIMSARQRPYAYYSTMESRGFDDNASFFSGHTSIAFSQAVANATMFSESFPEYEDLIWASLLGSAGLTAYFRVAGDQHYFSDVMVGAIVGSSLAWLITKHEMKKYPSKIKAESNFLFSLKIPLGKRF
jgi:hypothetical protein